jgi:hypothetical protein
MIPLLVMMRSTDATRISWRSWVSRSPAPRIWISLLLILNHSFSSYGAFSGSRIWRIGGAQTTTLSVEGSHSSLLSSVDPSSGGSETKRKLSKIIRESNLQQLSHLMDYVAHVWILYPMYRIMTSSLQWAFNNCLQNHKEVHTNNLGNHKEISHNLNNCGRSLSLSLSLPSETDGMINIETNRCLTLTSYRSCILWNLNPETWKWQSSWIIAIDQRYSSLWPLVIITNRLWLWNLVWQSLWSPNRWDSSQTRVSSSQSELTCCSLFWGCLAGAWKHHSCTRVLNLEVSSRP